MVDTLLKKLLWQYFSSVHFDTTRIIISLFLHIYEACMRIVIIFWDHISVGLMWNVLKKCSNLRSCTISVLYKPSPPFHTSSPHPHSPLVPLLLSRIIPSILQYSSHYCQLLSAHSAPYNPFVVIYDALGMFFLNQRKVIAESCASWCTMRCQSTLCVGSFTQTQEVQSFMAGGMRDWTTSLSADGRLRLTGAKGAAVPTPHCCSLGCKSKTSWLV